MQIIDGAGHHVYADKTDEFHRLVLTACKTVDEKPTSEEERVHEL